MLLPQIRKLLGAGLFASVMVVLAVLAAADLDRLQQLAQSRYGADVARQIGDWRGLVRQVQIEPESEKLARVNQFFNRRIRWVEDAELWQQEDYWATLLETMAKGAGDCEDFAIAKYVSLLIAGVQAAHAARLRLQLAALHAARGPDDLRAPAGWRLHPLKGGLKGHHALMVSGNWRLTFSFAGEDVELLDYIDYH